jgi:hypothetical protein
MGTFREHERLLALTPSIVLWGCFGGICLAVVYFFLQGMWDSYQLTDSRFSLYHDIHIIIVFAFLFAVLGFLAGELFSTRKNSREYRTGIISGTCTAFMFISILAFQKILLESAGFSDWIIPLAGIFVLSVVIQTIFAYSHEPRYGSGPDDPDTPYKPAITGKLRKYWYLIPTILAIVIIPPGLLFFGFAPGNVDMTCQNGYVNPDHCGYVNPHPLHYEQNVTTRFVEVNRTGPDSVRIVMRPDPGTGRGTPVDLLYDIEDAPDPRLGGAKASMYVSNKRHVAASGMNISIDPPEGLLYFDGDFVTLNGSDVFSNGTPTRRLVVIDTDPVNNNGSTIVYSGFV